MRGWRFVSGRESKIALALIFLLRWALLSPNSTANERGPLKLMYLEQMREGEIAYYHVNSPSSRELILIGLTSVPLYMYLCAWKMLLDVYIIHTYHESGDQGKRRGVFVLVCTCTMKGTNMLCLMLLRHRLLAWDSRDV